MKSKSYHYNKFKIQSVVLLKQSLCELCSCSASDVFHTPFIETLRDLLQSCQDFTGVMLCYVFCQFLAFIIKSHLFFISCILHYYAHRESQDNSLEMTRLLILITCQLEIAMTLLKRSWKLINCCSEGVQVPTFILSSR